jgi:IMP dehydrogenase
MTSVAQVLKSKPDTAVFTIDGADSVYNAIRLMAEKQIGALVVTDDAHAIVGIVTARRNPPRCAKS